MPKLIVTDRKGERHELDATVGWSVMEVIRENNLPIMVFNLRQKGNIRRVVMGEPIGSVVRD